MSVRECDDVTGRDLQWHTVIYRDLQHAAEVDPAQPTIVRLIRSFTVDIF